MQQFQGVNGEVLPIADMPDLLRVEHVLQRYRDVWTTTEVYPFLRVDVERLRARCAEVKEFAVFTNGLMMQNLSPEEDGGRLLSTLMGSGVDAGMSKKSEMIVEGAANPQAH